MLSLQQRQDVRRIFRAPVSHSREQPFDTEVRMIDASGCEGLNRCERSVPPAANVDPIQWQDSDLAANQREVS